MVDVVISEGEIRKVMAIRRQLYVVLQRVVEIPWFHWCRPRNERPSQIFGKNVFIISADMCLKLTFIWWANHIGYSDPNIHSRFAPEPNTSWIKFLQIFKINHIILYLLCIFLHFFQKFIRFFISFTIFFYNFFN